MYVVLENDIKICFVSFKIKIKVIMFVLVKGSVFDKYDMMKEIDIVRFEFSMFVLGLLGGDGKGIEIFFISEEIWYE